MGTQKYLPFQRCLYEAGKCLNDEDRLAFYDALLRNHFDDWVPDDRTNPVATALLVLSLTINLYDLDAE